MLSDSYYHNKLFLSNRFLLLHLLVIIFLIAVLYHTWGMASFSPLTDSEKREKIHALYEDYKRFFPDVVDIEPKLAMDLDSKLKILFLDDREQQEQSVSMLRGAIPVQTYLKNIEEYCPDIIISYCTISYRSGKLAQRLKQQGIKIYNLKGGIMAWVHDGGKIYDKEGETRRIHIYDPKLDLAPKGYQAVL